MSLDCASSASATEVNIVVMRLQGGGRVYVMVVDRPNKTIPECGSTRVNEHIWLCIGRYQCDSR